MKLWLLGTGTPTPSTQRMCSGYLVEADGDHIVFDHGFGAHHRLLELGVPATGISHAFFSHHHYDHMGDYPRLLLTRWDQGAGRIPELRVYGPPPLQEISNRLFGDDGAFGPDLISRTENQASIDVYHARGGKGPRLKPQPIITELSPNSVVENQGWTVRAVPVNHFAPHLVSFGYRIDCNGQSIVYSGDSGPCPALNRLAQDCDVLVHMCHYLTGTEPSKTFAAFTSGHLEVAEAARQANAKNLVISHVTEQFDKPGLRERVIVEMSRIYSGNIIFGADKMEIPVTAPQASKLD
ncbi:MBL fold metallo-hydrolase [Trinickia caryophylli]|uniref:Ribonuclease Z n=1 Tax=Trinickia caryophylli TaxID=28094 RepID=A0A1X7H787_TRICW|nr:MBL fold metallo-hydrolase [Trinickia caryophylli]PMS09430.1 MBL fold metallo-hydrolase [Trinickia caryophylli]TRX14140.1 MBL fold metallo-hydrolase [Trinickia caryophylli]WQE13962.1 MBL fold metallo-hydrolase [Trinickia caryophylli]SMF80897.1 ribonuclease Z [Trinickia caryophylli]GLU35692.1 MBL fold metallo-hydrolase [Trinickia caryophylli]